MPFTLFSGYSFPLRRRGQSYSSTTPPPSKRNPPSAAKPTSPHIAFYKGFARPIAKVFLGAIVTYQALYWVWAKLEMNELKELKKDEIQRLEDRVRELAPKKDGSQ